MVCTTLSTCPAPARRGLSAGCRRCAPARLAARLAAPLLAASLALGCGSENLKPPVLADQAELYWALELNHHAVVLSTAAPYDTLPLVAEPRNFRGEPLTTTAQVRYQSRDPEHVLVANGGVLVALSRTAQPVEVVATLTIGDITHTDSALVNVVDDPAPRVLASLSIQPVAPDSAKSPVFFGSGSYQPLDTLRPLATTSDGGRMPILPLDSAGYLPVYFRSSDTTIALIDRNVPQVLGVRTGTVTFAASATAFGVQRVDTLSYRIGWPVFGTFLVWTPYAWNSYARNDKYYMTPSPEVRIAVGGLVFWQSYTLTYPSEVRRGPDSLDITFDADVAPITSIRPLIDLLTRAYGPASAEFLCTNDCDGAGNLMLSTSRNLIARRFMAPGTYEFHSALSGLTGRVVVVEDQ